MFEQTGSGKLLKKKKWYAISYELRLFFKANMKNAEQKKLMFEQGYARKVSLYLVEIYLCFSGGFFGTDDLYCIRCLILDYECDASTIKKYKVKMKQAV